MREVRLPIIPVTAEAFAPFGRLLTPIGERSFGRHNMDAWTQPFRHEGAVRMQITRYHAKPLEAHLIERHLHVTETRQPLRLDRCALLVAPSSQTPPQPEAMTAFDLMGHGLIFHPGTWHSIDAYPLDGQASDYLFISEEATVSELFDGTQAPVRSQVHDYARDGVRIILG
jgi:ureidoglycolate hydrolase